MCAWQEWDPSPSARNLAPDNYSQLIYEQFDSNELAIVSYLRHRIRALNAPDQLSFGQLIYGALYANSWIPKSTFTPDPNHIHRHLIHLFNRPPWRIWTTNYDDLCEEAARLNSVAVRTLDPDHRTVGGELAVAHLHGFMPPPNRQQEEFGDPGKASVVLAEDDYHAIAAAVIGWTNREYHRLFDEHGVLILGMSLTDPNLRRVLSAIQPQGQSDSPKHFATMRTITEEDLNLKRVGANRRFESAADANEFRAWFWRQYDLEIIDLPDYDSILPFLVRLRYESQGSNTGDLWKEGSRMGYQAIDPWVAQRQEVAQGYLDNAIRLIAADFAVNSGEIVELGIFLLKPDNQTLELVFRTGAGVSAAPGAREFSADPDAPTGVAGRVFVSGAMVRVPRDHPLHDYGIASSGSASSSSYEGIISVPLVDWTVGIPIGVAYITVSDISVKLFSLQSAKEIGPGEQSLESLYWSLSNVAMTLLNGWRI